MKTVKEVLLMGLILAIMWNVVFAIMWLVSGQPEPEGWYLGKETIDIIRFIFY